MRKELSIVGGMLYLSSVPIEANALKFAGGFRRAETPQEKINRKIFPAVKNLCSKITFLEAQNSVVSEKEKSYLQTKNKRESALNKIRDAHQLTIDHSKSEVVSDSSSSVSWFGNIDSTDKSSVQDGDTVLTLNQIVDLFSSDHSVYSYKINDGLAGLAHSDINDSNRRSIVLYIQQERSIGDLSASFLVTYHAVMDRSCSGPFAFSPLVSEWVEVDGGKYQAVRKITSLSRMDGVVRGSAVDMYAELADIAFGVMNNRVKNSFAKQASLDADISRLESIYLQEAKSLYQFE